MAHTNLYTKAEYLGHYIFFYMLKLFGRLPAYFLLGAVVAVYVVCFPSSRKIYPYLQQRFPDSGYLKRIWQSFRLYFSFGQIAIDSVWQTLSPNNLIAATFPDKQKLLDILNQNAGMIILTAHIGNWQTALVNLKDLDVVVHAIMDIDQHAIIERFKGIGKNFKIIQPDESGFGVLIPALAALKRAEVVSIMGDRPGKGPKITTKFLNSYINVSALPYALARSSGAPIVLLFSYRVNRSSYVIRIWNTLTADTALDRESCFNKMARDFSKALEEYVMQHPFQWFNFPGIEITSKK